MTEKRSFFPLVLIITALLLCLTGCMPKFVDINDYLIYEADPDRPVTRLTMVATAEDMAQMDTNYPDLERLDLTGSTCYAEILEYVQAHPDVNVTYTVNVLGKEYGLETISINLSEMQTSQVSEVVPLLKHFPDLAYVELMKEDGTCSLTLDDVKTMQDTLDGVPCHYTFDLFGTTVSTSDTVIEFTDTYIGDEGLSEIKEAMTLMPALQKVRLDNCGTTSDAMAKMRTEYPDLQIHWRIWFGKYTCMTDEEMLRLTNGLMNEHVGELKYCTEAKYIDLGHNEYLSDISFFEYMPKAKIVILSGTAVSDVSAMKNCKELEWLELVFCSYLKDVSPLAGCTGLKYLNISITSVSELSDLDNVPLERFVALSMKNLTQSEREAFAAAHDDCLRVWYGTQPYGYGWRYSDQGYTFYKYYADMREIFDYDDKYFYNGIYYTKTRL